MKPLFDQWTHAPLGRHLPGHSVDTLAEEGWSEKSNGALLDLTDREGYAILVTTDQSLRYQQHLTRRRVGLVVLLYTNWSRIRLRTEEIAEAVESVCLGQVVEVPISPRG